VRLFVALYPPEDVRDALRRWLVEALARTDRSRARLTPVDRWHLTLAFLGDVPPDRMAVVQEAISRGVHGHRPMRLRLSGGGSFGRSSAVWAGVAGDVALLQGLHAALRRELADAGLPHDDRPLTPHLTVHYKGSRDVLEGLRDYAGPVWTATEVALVRSWFPQDGGYETVRTWQLAPSPS
jgi:2'-5' RNA ligase